MKFFFITYNKCTNIRTLYRGFFVDGAVERIAMPDTLNESGSHLATRLLTFRTKYYFLKSIFIGVLKIQTLL